jgi:hypothetical protein
VTDKDGIRTAEITRDKSGTTGATWSFKLQPVDIPRPLHMDPPVVCVPVEQQQAEVVYGLFDRVEKWTDDLTPLPHDVIDFKGKGSAAIIEVSRFMRFSTRGSVGVTRTEAFMAIREAFPDKARDTVYRAWQALVDIGRLEKAPKVNSPTGRSLWVDMEGDPK